MPKISEAGGPTDASQPEYTALGQSPQSPNVTANPDSPSEADYNDAMTRHGTDRFTDDDRKIVDSYQAARKADADVEKDKTGNRVGNEHLKGTEVGRDTKATDKPAQVKQDERRH